VTDRQRMEMPDETRPRAVQMVIDPAQPLEPA
jgi:hypothetical protein